MLQMHERRKWSKKTQTKAKVAWTVFNLLNVWLGIWAYTSKIWLFSYTSLCIAKLIVQLYTNPLIFLVLFRRNTTTYGSEWKPGNCPRGRRDTSSRCKGQSYMKLNFKYIFLVAFAYLGTFLKPFDFFRIFVVVVVLFVSLNTKSGEPVNLFVCLFGLFGCLFALSPYPYLANTMYLRWESQRKKNCFNFDWTIYNEWIISSRNPWGGSPCLRMSLSASASLSRSVVVLRPLSLQFVYTML